MKNSRLFCSISCMFVILMCFLNVVYAESPSDVNAAAESGLSHMLASIPKGLESKYGFANREEFRTATIGSPYQMQTIHPEVMKSNAAITDDMITSAEEWRFPVICDGRARALLTVAKVEGRWQAVDIGAAILASEIDTLEKGLSLATRKVNRTILRLYQIRSDFIVITDGSGKVTTGSFYPVRSADKGIRGSQTENLKFSSSTFQDLLPGLRDRYRNEDHPENNTIYEGIK
jgi:hypothetical protein